MKVRNNPSSSDRVSVSPGPGLSQLPEFSIFTVYPPGSTVRRPLTIDFRPRNPRNDANVTSGKYLPLDVREWTNDERELIAQQLSKMGLIESSVESADEQAKSQGSF